MAENILSEGFKGKKTVTGYKSQVAGYRLQVTQIKTCNLKHET